MALLALVLGLGGLILMALPYRRPERRLAGFMAGILFFAAAFLFAVLGISMRLVMAVFGLVARFPFVSLALALILLLLLLLRRRGGGEKVPDATTPPQSSSWNSGSCLRERLHRKEEEGGIVDGTLKR